MLLRHCPHRFLSEVRQTITKVLSARYTPVISDDDNTTKNNLVPLISSFPHSYNPYRGTRLFFTNYAADKDE